MHGGAMPCCVGVLLMIGEANSLHCIEVVEIAPELLEAVCGRQSLNVIAKVVLAELAGVVAEIMQEHGEGRRARTKIRRTAGELRRDHPCAQRMHAGEESIAPRGATLLGIVIREDARRRCQCGRCWAFLPTIRPRW